MTLFESEYFNHDLKSISIFIITLVPWLVDWQKFTQAEKPFDWLFDWLQCPDATSFVVFSSIDRLIDGNMADFAISFL